MEISYMPLVVPMITTISVAAAVMLLVFTINYIRDSMKKYHPVGGTTINQLMNFNRLHDYFCDLAKTHKTYRLLDLFCTAIMTADPAVVEHILKTNFPNYVKGSYHYNILTNLLGDGIFKNENNGGEVALFVRPHEVSLSFGTYKIFNNYPNGSHHYNILTDLLGDGIFAVDGDKWRHQRKVSSHEFSTRNLKDFSSDVFRTNAVKLADIVTSAAASNQIIEVQDLFMKSTLDSVFKVVLGVELDTMCGTLEEGRTFSKAFDEASEITLYRYVDPFWRIKRYFNIGSEAVLKRNIKVIHDFVYGLIRSKIEQVNKSPNDSQVKKRDVISRFLESKETDDPKYLKDIVLSFVIAGKDSTATTLSWFLYMLCKHPHIQENIAKEVKEATRTDDNASIDQITSRLTEEALDKMQYLHATLSETLRLYPAVPTDGKFCLSDDILPDGFIIRKGDSISYNPYSMGRMKFIWGEDAEEFKPERWLDDDGVYRQESSFKFTAFQAGPRICLGKEFAYRQMKIFAAVLLGGFIFKLNDEKKPVNYRVMLTLLVDDGLYLRAYNRFTR